jgi:hypothetical protein
LIDNNQQQRARATLVSSSDGEEVSPKSGVRGWFRDLSRTRKIVTVILSVAGGLVTIGTAIGMIFTVVAWLFPSVQTPPPATEGGATLSNLEVVRTVTLGEYLRWPGMPANVQGSQVSEERRRRLGNIIRFDLELRGLAGESVSLKWSVFDADTGKPVGGLTEQPAWPQNYVQPQHNVSRNQFETWVPFPRNDEGTFLVTLEVYATIEGSEVRLDAEEVKVSTPEKGTASS